MAAPILVSACLAGLCTDWCGRSARRPWIEQAVAQGKAIPVCPEQLGGLATPRVPAEERDGRVVSMTGRDVTPEYKRGARTALEIARRHGCEVAVLKARSPSCGVDSVYDGTFTRRLVKGEGVTARVLREAGLRVVSDEEAGETLLVDESCKFSG